MRLVLRPFREEDAGATLDLFRAAVRITAAVDYTPIQLNAWAPEDIDLDQWTERRMRADTVVAWVGAEMAGFTDVAPTGYINMLFVHPDHGRRGVASALIEWAHRTAAAQGAVALTTHASRTARPFFEAHSFTVDAERRPVRRGVELVNFTMSRPI